MKKLAIVLALLASAGVAQAVTLDVGEVIVIQGQAVAAVPVTIQGNAQLQAVEATVEVAAGVVPTAFEIKSGVLNPSTVVPSDALIDGQIAWASYSFPPGGNAQLSGEVQPLGVLTLDISAAAPGVYSIVWNGDVFPLGITVTTASPDQTVEFTGGSVTILPIPEPASALLLGLGGLFLRRRSA